MPAAKGRARQSPRKPTDKKLLNAWVPEEIRDKVERAADSLGISMAMYMIELIAHDELDETGRPTWYPAEVEEQEEFPLRTA